ncbi:hypothetical protein ACHAXA_011132 [Cyclostephanos tholiformis]|uniref:Uncharacterized protein n=1 Tax=Cyclostephanos tholiformis TaxID=382380 RepID=A0ABD3SF21_9STRA
MVRKKSRWLLVQFDFEGDIPSSCANRDGEAVGSGSSAAAGVGGNKRRRGTANNVDGDVGEAIVVIGRADESRTTSMMVHQITCADIYRSIRDSIVENYGIVGASASDLQVRSYDPKLRLAIVRTNRYGYPNVRSSLTTMTSIRMGGDVLRVVASTKSVSGSARTARNAARDEILRRFGEDVKMMKDRRGGGGGGRVETWTKRARIALEKGLVELEGRLDKFDSGC